MRHIVVLNLRILNFTLFLLATPVDLLFYYLHGLDDSCNVQFVGVKFTSNVEKLFCAAPLAFTTAEHSTPAATCKLTADVAAEEATADAPATTML